MKLPSISFLYEQYKLHPQVQTDTRKLKSGDLYFALKGPNFNGNNFAIAALENGASFAIVDESIEKSESFENRILQVDDVLTTLQNLAKHHRAQFDIPFIGIHCRHNLRVSQIGIIGKIVPNSFIRSISTTCG